MKRTSDITGYLILKPNKMLNTKKTKKDSRKLSGVKSRYSSGKTKDIIADILSLPIEQRAMAVDSLLKSFNPPETEIDKEWTTLAKLRLEEIRSSKANVVKGKEVFKKIWKRFSE